MTDIKKIENEIEILKNEIKYLQKEKYNTIFSLSNIIDFSHFSLDIFSSRLGFFCLNSTQYNNFRISVIQKNNKIKFLFKFKKHHAEYPFNKNIKQDIKNKFKELSSNLNIDKLKNSEPLLKHLKRLSKNKIDFSKKSDYLNKKEIIVEDYKKIKEYDLLFNKQKTCFQEKFKIMKKLEKRIDRKSVV